MNIKVQIDSEIPEHIVDRVTGNSRQLEENLGKKHKLRFDRPSRKKRLDAGLTVRDNQSEEVMDIVLQDNSEGLSSFKTLQEEKDSDDEVDVSGKSMFGFQSSQKKPKYMNQKNLEEPVQEKKKEKTRKSRPSTKRKQMEAETKKTDYTKKRRVQRQLQSLKDDQGSSDEEKATSDEEEEEEKGERLEGTTTDGYERYFQDFHGTSKTSNNTLSKLQLLEPEQFRGILDKAPKKHKNEMLTLSEMQKQHFPQWYFELQSGFNLVFYGYGSKRRLLNDFSQNVLTDGPLIVINGFFPSISIKDVLTKITASALKIQAPAGQLDDHVAFICNYFSLEDREYESLYIVVHNIDGPSLRNERTQMALSALASAENIHLIASVDHINAGLLWDNVKSSQFNWIWHDATTFDDYLVETSFENSLLTKKSGLGGSRGAKFVLNSLTSNAREVFRILAEHQLIEMDLSNMESKGDESVGLSYGQYYQKCREGFFVSSDPALRAELTEFRDHELITSKKAMDGTELFFIPLDKLTLLQILEQM